MRIGGGEFRGRRLKGPSGLQTRPTSARLKKSLFDVLAGRIASARVLDLYAGVGALGLEALSRGAASAVFVERRRQAAAAIEENVEAFELTERARVVTKDVFSALSRLVVEGESFDIVFADPPYRSSDAEKLLRFLGEETLVAPDGIVVIEHHHKKTLDARYGQLERSRELKAGESRLTLYAPTCYAE
jgi:16S rRNA (guanine966-N2)-methyltransferase